MQWLISDIHGCYHTLLALISKVQDADPKAKLVFIGDYVDRGRNSSHVVNYLIGLQEEGAICLRGNHDDVIDYLVNGYSKSEPTEWVVGKPDKAKVARWFVVNGLEETLDSYGVPIMTSGPYGQIDYEGIANTFKEQMPDEHRRFFRDLKMFWENDTHFSCHAYFDPLEELPRDFRFVRNDKYTECLWSRFPGDERGLSKFKIVWNKIGVFGHTPTLCYGSPAAPVYYDKVRLIDGGSFKGSYAFAGEMEKGFITAYCCDKDSHIIQTYDKRDVLERVYR